MDDRKVSNILDRIITITFTIFIGVGIGISLISFVTTVIVTSEVNGIEEAVELAYDTVNWMVIIVSFLFWIAYVLGRKYYRDHFNCLPQSYYYIAMLFSLMSVYLGSYLNFYEAIYWWDIMLHFISGILLGFICIIFVSFAIKSFFGEFKTKKDIIFLVVVGVLVSISFSVFWELYEYLYDYITGGNMQEGLVIKDNATSYDMTPHMYSTGRVVGLDLTDTMFDQFLAVTGSIIAGVYSYFHFSAIQLRLNGQCNF